ncbi:MAG TPA: WhiB family transcriptional regulator [Acidimicrobiia bacterium]|nr:WhiB family transcriptional regulator [Acidimicrobiia bacterium]
MAIQMTERTWQLRAACRGPESVLFFPPTTPERKDERDAREAKAKSICAACPVQVACLDYALSIREPHGIWGGLTEAERRLLVDLQPSPSQAPAAAVGKPAAGDEVG